MMSNKASAKAQPSPSPLLLSWLLLAPPLAEPREAVRREPGDAVHGGIEKVEKGREWT